MISTTTIIVYNNDEGGISIVHPVVSEINPATGTHFTIEEIAQKVVVESAGISTYSIIDDAVCPNDRTFRNSWSAVGIGTTAVVTEDMTKAKEIHKTNIRNVRSPLLAALDIEFQKALETSADTSAIVTKKQALRDAPAASGISTAASEADLKAQWDTTNLGTSPYT